MILDRSKNDTGCGKYVVINTRKLLVRPNTATEAVNWATACPEAVELGAPFTQNEFFVLMLKDKYAEAALQAYAEAAMADDPEYGMAVLELVRRAGRNSPFCKTPD